VPLRSSLPAGALALAGALLAGVPPAGAIPVFAHRYGLSCQACHTAVPHLTPFGERFLADGYRIRGVGPKPAFPVAVKVQTAYATAAEEAEGGGKLPKAVVDEVELLTGGSIGARGSYFAEAYVVDGGQPGRPRDVWAAWRATPDGARTPVTVRGGQFTLPLPIDPETFRETTGHFAIWDQTVGANPFDFFAPKIGAQIALGDPARALAGSVSLLKGHDAGSGLSAHGVDMMLTLQRTFDDVTLSAYRYDGSRAFAASGAQTLQPADRFWRDGFGLGWQRGRTRVEAAYQSGNDGAAGGSGAALRSSGGFVQLRHELGSRTFAIARWDATQDTAFSRSAIGGLGYRFSRNTRLTVFDTAKRDENGRLAHTLSSSFLFAL
jgi:hypothetical protein